MEVIIESTLFSSIFVLITQSGFMYYRTINIIHTTTGEVYKSAISNLLTTIISLFGTSVGIKHVLDGNYTVVIFYLIGSTIGQVIGMRKRNR